MEFEALLLQINELMHRSMQRFKQEAIGKNPRSDMTIAQLSYVEALFRLKRPTLSELAKELRLSMASSSTGIHKLIHKGMVTAERSREDQRVIYLSLTANGRKLIEAETRAFRQFSDGIRKTLTAKEIQLLEGLFEKIVKTGLQE